MAQAHTTVRGHHRASHALSSCESPPTLSSRLVILFSGSLVQTPLPAEVRGSSRQRHDLRVDIILCCYSLLEHGCAAVTPGLLKLRPPCRRMPENGLAVNHLFPVLHSHHIQYYCPSYSERKGSKSHHRRVPFETPLYVPLSTTLLRTVTPIFITRSLPIHPLSLVRPLLLISIRDISLISTMFSLVARLISPSVLAMSALILVLLFLLTIYILLFTLAQVKRWAINIAITGNTYNRDDNKANRVAEAREYVPI